ncbi:hypothetical protein BDZ97DRAFT_1928819 [Flammula alnicola]|nr:hypothetical protein BDZ97DRAFT_1928819 [Flammula alnicola]
MNTSTLFEDNDEQIDHPNDISNLFPRLIKDPIHNYIPVCSTLSRFIDTKQFQRLRNIKQLGTTHYVWPGGSHTRFEHCLGVAFLARTMATHLKRSQPELGITDRDINCVEIAGLCHDLGHGPWSHVWDGLFMPEVLKNSDKTWKHEDGSEMMFDYLVRDNEVPISAEDQSFVKALIAGEPSRTPDEKAFLFDIVANKRNGLDVDKFDYIHRDSHMIGDPIHLSLVRLVNSARVLDNQICYDVKDANHIYEICVSRFKLHKIFYNHKTAKAIEYMIIDALIAAEPALHIAESVFSPEKFLHLTDNIMARIEASEDPELAESRAIFDRMHKRDLYKCVDYKVIDWPLRQLFRQHITPKHIVEAVQRLAEDPSSTTEGLGVSSPTNSARLEVSDVIVDFSTMHYGMKEKNPLDFVRFYSKGNQIVNSSRAERGDYSNLMPQYFAEDLIRVYTKKPEFFGLVQAGYRSILASMQDRTQHDDLDNLVVPSINLDPMAPTPPATEAPSTPRLHSRNASFSFTAGGGGNGSAATPFSNNSFTTVSPSFAPASPTRAGRGRSNKRRRDDSPALDATLKRRK